VLFALEELLEPVVLKELTLPAFPPGKFFYGLATKAFYYCVTYLILYTFVLPAGRKLVLANPICPDSDPRSSIHAFVIRDYPVQPYRAMTTGPDEHKQPSPTDTRPAYAVPNAATAGNAFYDAKGLPVLIGLPVRTSGLGSTQDIPCLALRARRAVRSPIAVMTLPRDCVCRCFWSTHS
jgi:hypothetical protein